MICKHCSTENADNAVFCKNCGKRLDGKKICPKCKALIEEDAVWCTACGKTQTTTETKKKTTNAGDSATCGWKKITSVISLSFGIAGAMVAFIFMFFMGISATITPTSKTSIPSLYMFNLAHEFNIFNCFGKNLQTLSETAYTMNTDFLSGAQWFYAIVETILAVVIIALTTTFFIMAVCCFIRTLLGKKTKWTEKAIFITIISYIAGAVCFRSLDYVKMTTTSTYPAIFSSEICYSFNGVTVAGLIISLVLGAIMVALKIAVKGSSLRGAMLLKTIVSGITTIVAIVILLLLSGQFTLSEPYSSINRTTTSGFMVIIGYVATRFGYSNYYNSSLQQPAETTFIVGIIGHIVTIILIAMLAVFIIYSATHTISEKRKSPAGIILSSVLLLFSIVFIAISIIALNNLRNFIDAAEYPAELNFLSVLLISCTVLFLILEIEYFVIQRKSCAKEQTIQN